MRYQLCIMGVCASLLLLGCHEMRISNRGDDSLPPPSPRDVPRANVPDHAPAHGVRKKYSYYYYPQAEVYYAPDREQYFWLEVGEWRFGTNLPSRIFIDINDAIYIDLETATPYERHDQTSKKYKKRGRGRGRGPGKV